MATPESFDFNEIFTCRECLVEKPRSEHLYPKAQKPSMCKTCARLRRQKGTVAPKRMRALVQSRMTLSLSSRHQAIISALASSHVYESKSHIVESALDAMLDQQPQAIKDFVRFLEQQS